MRNRGGWTREARLYIERANAVLKDLENYWPLTLRQVYYQLVAAGVIPNKPVAYSKLSRLLVKARLDRLTPWEALEDRAREVLHSTGFQNANQFALDETKQFLIGYRRDLIQSQPLVLEVWVEKDALSRICHRAAFPYCVPVVVARGFSSVSYLHDCRRRVEGNARNGQVTKILYFGDLDPSGWFMLPAMMETLRREMGLGELITAERCALLPAQVEEFSLIRNPDAIKPGDTRTKAYVEQFGDLAVELDALSPESLEGFVRLHIEESLNMDLFVREKEIEKKERFLLAKKRKEVIKLLK